MAPRKSTQPRDYSKYLFEGEVLGKGRLVLALVRRYVADHPRIDLALLREVFPDRLQGQSPLQFSAIRVVVAPLEALSTIEQKRFFVGPGEPIALADGSTVVVSTEWNRFNIQNILERAETLGYVVACTSHTPAKR